MIFKIKEILDKDIPAGASETIEDFVQDENSLETLHEDLSLNNRSVQAIASEKHLDVFIKGIPERKTIHGGIVKAFFNHERCPGKVLESGLIDYREINKFPVVEKGDKLFFIANEQKGIPGITFDGKLIPVEDAKPFQIRLKDGVEIVDTIDEFSDSAGYYLRALKTGVVTINRDDDENMKDIGIGDEVKLNKLDYSTGNIGTEFTSPISMRVGVICDGFKLHVNGKVEAKVVDGGEIRTDSYAVVTKIQANSVVSAIEDVTVDSSISGTNISDNGTVKINKELIDSKVMAPKILFTRSRGILTSSVLDTENIELKHIYLRGENVIQFGNNLFTEKKRHAEFLNESQAKELELEAHQKELMEKLQNELKKITRLAQQNPALAPNIKGLILATREMDFDILFSELDAIQKMNSTRVVGNVRKLLEDLEKVPVEAKRLETRIDDIYRTIKEINQRLTGIRLKVEGDLSPAASIKVYCGIYHKANVNKPDFIIESDDTESKPVNISGSYTVAGGFQIT